MPLLQSGDSNKSVEPHNMYTPHRLSQNINQTKKQKQKINKNHNENEKHKGKYSLLLKLISLM